MARIDLRDCTIRLKDGLSGTAVINDASISQNDTTLSIAAVNAVGTLTTNDAGVITVEALAVGTAWNGKSIVFSESATPPASTPTAVYANDTLTITVNNASNTTTANIVAAIDLLADWDATETTPGEYEPSVDASVNATTASGTNNVLLNTTDTDLVPLGARFTVPNTASQVFTVTARTPTAAGPTTSITFTPALTANIPANAATITFEAQRLDITIGEGNLTYTEAKEYEYLKNRGVLDTVREGEDQPLDVSLEFAYEFVTTGTGEAITPVDAVKQINGASEWVSASSDLCEPYCVDIEIDRSLSCGSTEDETTILADFRYESLEYSLQDATISVSGKCNITDATVTRS